MPTMTLAVNAYQASSAHRDPRDQEAEVFQWANGSLRAARDANPIARVRAVADNRRLWTAVIDLVRNPSNVLPDELRASIASVGIAVQREMDRDAPDFDFLININDSFALGLLGKA
jgi:flagellar biosynthesis regulator FlaF